MEVSVIGSSHLNLGRNIDNGFFSPSQNLNVKICNRSRRFSMGRSQSLYWPSKSGFGFTLRACSSSQNGVDIASEKSAKITINDMKLYVGLPLDAVSNSNIISHPRAIAAGLKALKLLGVDGVELPVYWGIVEKESMGKHEWDGYLSLVEMVQKLGLKVHVSLCFHSAEDHKISLPEWVSRAGESDPDIYFTDRSGQQYKGCLSLAVSSLPVLDRKTPFEVYQEFLDSFKSTFSSFLGSTITGISIGLGPDGELRYPSHHGPVKSNSHFGAGEFQCYDRYMLANLKQHAEMQGNPLWGLGGPHDSPGYEHNPVHSGFLMENGGSWESLYGDFFLSWYSNLLISHGDRILSLAASTFKDVPITVSGKVPLMHSWYRARSHPSEVTSGFYNTDNRDGYRAISKIFSRNSCKMIIPGMNLSDEQLPSESRSSPELLLQQITSSCTNYGVDVSGENLMVSGVSMGFEQIKKIILDDSVPMSVFTYQRIGAYFFSPEHFSLFAQFVRSLKHPVQSSDDLPAGVEETSASLHCVNLQLQAA